MSSEPALRQQRADLNAHVTASNDLAEALVDANPGRFQEASPSEYFNGIDF
jgi:hypothetical protein